MKFESEHNPAGTFIREAWERKAAGEKGEELVEISTGDKREEVSSRELSLAGKTFFEIKEAVDDSESEELREALREVISCISNYVRAVGSLRVSQVDPEKTGKELEDSDFAQKRAHDSLYDAINILSRLFRKNEIDNRWRGVIGSGIVSPEDRKQIGKWALSVAQFVVEKDTPKP